jgi:hypothetical protein
MMKRTSKWIPVGRAAILLSLVVLYFNAYMLFTEIRREVIYNNHSYGLEVLNDYFDEGNYYQIYEKTVQNKYSNQELAVDISQYEAFGQYYHNYVMARTHTDNAEYLALMNEAKQKITWKKVLNVIEMLEQELH